MGMNEDVYDGMLLRDIEIQRFMEWENRRTSLFFEQLYQRMKNELVDVDPLSNENISWRKRTLRDLERSYSATLGKGYQSYDSWMKRDLLEFAHSEAEWTRDLFNRGARMDLMRQMVTPDWLKAVVNGHEVQGGPMGDWLSRQAVSAQQRLMNTIRLGMAEGRSIPEISKMITGASSGRSVQIQDPITGAMRTLSMRHGGLAQVAAGNASGIARTATAGIAAEARRDMMMSNRDVVKGIQQISTLDGRTTETCVMYDGEAWEYEDSDFPERSRAYSPKVSKELMKDNEWNKTHPALQKWRNLSPEQLDQFRKKYPDSYWGITDHARKYNGYQMNDKRAGIIDDRLKQMFGKPPMGGQVPSAGKTPTWLGFKEKHFNLLPKELHKYADLTPDELSMFQNEYRSLKDAVGNWLNQKAMNPDKTMTPAEINAILKQLEEIKAGGRKAAEAAKKAAQAAATKSAPPIVPADLAGRVTTREQLRTQLAAAREGRSLSGPKLTKDEIDRMLREADRLDAAAIRQAEKDAISMGYPRNDPEFGDQVADLLSHENYECGAMRLRSKKLAEEAMEEARKYRELSTTFDAKKWLEERFMADYREDVFEFSLIGEDTANQVKGFLSTGSRPANAEYWLTRMLGFDESFPTLNLPTRMYRPDFRAGYSNGVLEMPVNAPVKAWIHEIGHFLEENLMSDAGSNSWWSAAKDFLKKRAAGEKPKKLADLFPKLGYGSDELVFTDRFREPYYGKIMKSGQTELFSMGLEDLYTDPQGLWDEDPEFFEWLLDMILRARFHHGGK